MEALLQKIYDTLREAWKVFDKQPLFWLLLGVVFFIFVSAFSYAGGFGSGLLQIARSPWIQTIGMLIAITGGQKLVLDAVQGKTITVKMLIERLDVLWKVLVVNILFGFAVGMGFAFLIIPGVYIFLTYVFVPMIIIDTNMPIDAAIKRSAEMTKGNKALIGGVLLFLILVNSVMTTFFAIGTVITTPFFILALGVLYDYLSKDSKKTEPILA